MKITMLTWAVSTLLLQGSAIANPSLDYGKRLFERLAGVPLNTTDPRYQKYSDLIAAKDLKGAASVATDDNGFYNTTLRDWAAIMANKDGSPLIDLDDFQATVIGAVRDDADARTLLTGNYSYRVDASAGLPEPSLSNNDHYKAIGDQHRRRNQHNLQDRHRGNRRVDLPFEVLQDGDG